MRYKYKKIDLKKGAGEVMAFLLCLPCLLLILYLVVDIIHIGSIRERIEYTAYKAARAAVICKDLDEANEVANEIAVEDILNSGMNIDEDSMDWDKVAVVTMADGSDINSVGKSGEKKSDLPDKSKWEKGNFIQCTVSVNIKTANRFSSGRRSAVVTMMVEAYDEEDGIYPWFKKLAGK